MRISFISVFLSIYDFSTNRVWHGGANYPEKGHKYFGIYKQFFIEKLIENKIKVIYLIKPLWGDDDILINILNPDCYSKKTISYNLVQQTLLDCNQLKARNNN